MIIGDKITVGDWVYIGGLIGKEFTKFNNKIGIIKKIITPFVTNQIVYIADVNIRNYLLPINFNYLFKINNNNNNIITEDKSHVLDIEHYFLLHRVVKHKLGITETGESQAVCLTKERSIISITLTTLN